MKIHDSVCDMLEHILNETNWDLEVSFNFTSQRWKARSCRKLNKKNKKKKHKNGRAKHKNMRNNMKTIGHLTSKPGFVTPHETYSICARRVKNQCVVRFFNLRNRWKKSWRSSDPSSVYPGDPSRSLVFVCFPSGRGRRLTRPDLIKLATIYFRNFSGDGVNLRSV